MLFVNLVIRHPAEMPPLLEGQTATEWRITVINAAIYWALQDSLEFSWLTLQWWLNIKNPFLRLGVLFGAVMGVLNVLLTLRREARVRRLAIFCTECQTHGRPIAGTWNRYRCRTGHQFNGDPHGVA
jgi:hypothetical protein